MADNFAFPIPKEVLEPFIKEAVSTSIIGALGDGTKIITQAVQETLKTKVDINGNVSKYSSDNRYTLLDVLAQKEMRKVVAEVLKEYVLAMRPRIEAGIRKAISANAEDLGSALFEKYMGGIYKDLGVYPRTKPHPNSEEEDD